MTIKSLGMACALALSAAVPSAYADLIIDASDLTPGALVQTFDDAAGYDNSASRVQIGQSLSVDLGVSALGGTLNFGAPYGAWSLGDNGEWTGNAFAGVDGDFVDSSNGIAASLVFDFGDKTVSEVGALMNFDPGFVYGAGLPLPLFIAAYDKLGNEVESHFLPVWTPADDFGNPALNTGMFFGIRSASANISRFEISGPYAVVDNVSFSAPVPEPQSWALALAGIAIGFGCMRQQRRK